nr:hypothetical protein GCM10017547_32100 [Pseudarthrobacter oxydans]
MVRTQDLAVLVGVGLGRGGVGFVVVVRVEDLLHDLRDRYPAASSKGSEVAYQPPHLMLPPLAARSFRRLR